MTTYIINVRRLTNYKENLNLINNLKSIDFDDIKKVFTFESEDTYDRFLEKPKEAEFKLNRNLIVYSFETHQTCRESIVNMLEGLPVLRSYDLYFIKISFTVDEAFDPTELNNLDIGYLKFYIEKEANRVAVYFITRLTIPKIVIGISAILYVIRGDSFSKEIVKRFNKNKKIEQQILELILELLEEDKFFNINSIESAVGVACFFLASTYEVKVNNDSNGPENAIFDSNIYSLLLLAHFYDDLFKKILKCYNSNFSKRTSNLYILKQLLNNEEQFNNIIKLV